ncbi:CBO0543 family protein [Bacillus tuaregi]|uniref:CBO0543 family protein n=1 Tax=Bacillus tuaregi TaxID=1816695 RepID=UPI0008F843F9|nr:CBO0543 family protein [Bacillus tuaregi]
MNIVKHLKGLKLPPLPKRQSFSKKEYIVTAILASLIGTYLDLYFVGKGIYEFPQRPLPEFFTIHIGFTLFGLPVSVILLLSFLSRLNNGRKIVFILIVSLLMAVFERFSELLGFFQHSAEWKHYYTFFGYALFLIILTVFFHWVKKQ